MGEFMKNRKNAGFWVRFFACLIDTILLTLVSLLLEWMILGILFWVGILRGAGEAGVAVDSLLFQIINLILYTVSATFYYVYGHAHYQTTFGKSLFKLEVLDLKTFAPITLKQSTLRYVGYGISALPFATGYLMALIHPDKRALHDLISGSGVFQKERDQMTNSEN